MKIDEIMLDEGALDKLKAGLAGAKAGMQAGAQQRAGQDMQNRVAAEFIKRWQGAVAQNPEINTPQAIKQLMTNAMGDVDITIPEPPATLNAVSSAQYITKVIGQILAAGTLGQRKTDTTAGAETPGAAQTAPAKPELTPGFTMTDDDPVTIRYKKQDFIRNDQGYWAPLSAPTKPITDSATAKMFDKQEQAVENWKAAQSGTTPPPPKTTPTTPPPAADADATDTGTAPADATAPTSAKPDDRTPNELLSPKGIRDPETEVFIPGHGIMQKQEDGSWRHLPKKAPINNKDWAALDKRLEAAKAVPADSATAEPAPDATVLPGAPVNSTYDVSSGAVTVGFKKTDKGWINAKPTAASTTHGPGSKGYDALERAWARKNGKSEPEPTVGTSTSAPTATPAMTESFRRLSKITHGKL